MFSLKIRLRFYFALFDLFLFYAITIIYISNSVKAQYLGFVELNAQALILIYPPSFERFNEFHQLAIQ